MNLSYNWLKELVQFDLSPEELGHRLTMAGLTIEEYAKSAGDTMMAAEVTTNRPDWLGHWGVAREIAALLGREAKFPEWKLDARGPEVSTLTSVTNEAQDLCPRYTARVIRGVKIKESPAWLKTRLEAIGLRPINNVVDVTNYVLMEMNQPLHAFDLDLLRGKRIVVRRSRKGEKMTAIDGTECVLTENNLVIADAERAVAVAGVMGGSATEVSDKTVNILLESAYFEPKQIRRTSRALKLSSDSSYRFERGIDMGGVERASSRAAQLILELAGGELAAGVIDDNPGLGQPRPVEMRLARCEAVLGTRVDPARIEAILRGLGLQNVTRDASRVRALAPSFRQDLSREIDLIEEVVRLHGYEKVPTRVQLRVECRRDPEYIQAARMARETLAGLGYHECITDAFVPERWLEQFPCPAGEPLRVANPVNLRRPLLRTSLVPSLLEVRMVNRNEQDVRLFEINHAYHAAGREPACLAIVDDRGPEYVRGAFEAFLRALRVEAAPELEVRDSLLALEPGTGGELHLGGETVARFGRVNQEQVKLHDLSLAPAALEADLGRIALLPRRERLFAELPRFPAVRRDIALVTPETVQWREIRAVAGRQSGQAEEITLQSVYRGKGLEAGTKSVAFTVVYRNRERSLTDEEANTLRDRLVESLVSAIPGTALRT